MYFVVVCAAVYLFSDFVVVLPMQMAMLPRQLQDMWLWIMQIKLRELL